MSSRCPGYLRAVAAGPRRMERQNPWYHALRFGRLTADNIEGSFIESISKHGSLLVPELWANLSGLSRSLAPRPGLCGRCCRVRQVRIQVRTAVGALGIVVGLGSLAYSPFPMFVTFLGWAFEGELGNPDAWSWLPWALAFDTFPFHRRYPWHHRRPTYSSKVESRGNHFFYCRRDRHRINHPRLHFLAGYERRRVVVPGGGYCSCNPDRHGLHSHRRVCA